MPAIPLLNTFCNLQPANFQQTVKKSFTLGGLGLHTGEYGMLHGQFCSLFTLIPLTFTDKLITTSCLQLT